MVDIDTFLTILYVMVDDFCKQSLVPERRPGPAASLTRSEVLTLALFGQWHPFASERDFYRYAQQHLRGAFPTLPDRACVGSRMIGHPFDEQLGLLLLPLLGQMRRAQHRQPAHLAPIQQLAGDQRRLHGLADADIVGDQQPHRIEPQPAAAVAPGLWAALRRSHRDGVRPRGGRGHHQPLRVWMGCWYLMGLKVSNRQIAHESGLNEGDAQRMSEQLRQGVVAAQPEPRLSGEVECDEVYVVAGHKGRPDAVKKTRLANLT